MPTPWVLNASHGQHSRRRRDTIRRRLELAVHELLLPLHVDGVDGLARPGATGALPSHQSERFGRESLRAAAAGEGMELGSGLGGGGVEGAEKGAGGPCAEEGGHCDCWWSSGCGQEVREPGHATKER